MALTDENVRNKIKHMIAFIEQEASEKYEEICTKAEEEFNIEKGHIVQTQRLKLIEFYEKKQKQIELNKKIQTSNLLNNARLRVLKAREDHIKHVLDETTNRLTTLTQNPEEHVKLLYGLILQSLLQLLEEKVVIKCRKKDVSMVQQATEKSKETYSKMTGKSVTVSINQQVFLPEATAGGVEVSTVDGKLKVVNTLESRLELVSQQIQPELKEMLFGPNPNRKFHD